MRGKYAGRQPADVTQVRNHLSHSELGPTLVESAGEPQGTTRATTVFTRATTVSTICTTESAPE